VTPDGEAFTRRENPSAVPFTTGRCEADSIGRRLSTVKGHSKADRKEIRLTTGILCRYRQRRISSDVRRLFFSNPSHSRSLRYPPAFCVQRSPPMVADATPDDRACSSIAGPWLEYTVKSKEPGSDVNSCSTWRDCTSCCVYMSPCPTSRPALTPSMSSAE